MVFRTTNKANTLVLEHRKVDIFVEGLFIDARPCSSFI